ncbi:MAG: glycosyltransferase [Alphaproteobacteria bacterium]|nr:glycosyltransferase [Alphaproteobacteria bacterium]
MSTEPLRILHVITGLGLGGAENMLTSLVLRSADTGMIPSVVSLVPGGENAARIHTAGVPISDLGMQRGLPDPRAVRRLALSIRAARPHVIQSWMYHADLMALAARVTLARAERPRLVWGVRCSDMDVSRYGPALRLIIAACARLSARPDAVLVNSHAGRTVHEKLGYHPRRFEVLENGVDTERFRPDPAARAEMRRALGLAPDAIVLAHVARRDPMKDHESYLAALDRLPHVTGLAIGLDTERLPARPNLRRLGPRTDVPRLLAAADFVISSSAFGEGFPNVLAEGMATGAPAVATDVGDAARIVGDTGRIVKPRDAEALARAIAALAGEDAAARAARRERARTRIENAYPLARSAQAYAALYRSLA